MYREYEFLILTLITNSNQKIVAILNIMILASAYGPVG